MTDLTLFLFKKGYLLNFTKLMYEIRGEEAKEKKKKK